MPAKKKQPVSNQVVEMKLTELHPFKNHPFKVLDDELIYSLIADLIAEVQSGKDYSEALDEAYTRIYQSIDPSYKPNGEIGIDRIYLDIPAADVVKFSRARKFLLEAIPQTE